MPNVVFDTLAFGCLPLAPLALLACLHYLFPACLFCLSKVASCPPGAQAAQLDFADAYCQMAVLHAHQPFLAVMTYLGIFIDHCNPFGLSSAAGTLGVATDATLDIVMAALPVPFFIKWVDDLLPTHVPSSEPSPRIYHYSYELVDIVAIIKSLGWHVNDIKTKDFAPMVVYVGFQWDLTNKHVSLPEEKRLKHLTKLLDVLSLINASGCLQLGPLVNLQGSLAHLCFVYCDGQSKMPSLHHFITSFHNNIFIHCFPPPHLLTDLAWWQAALELPAFVQPIGFHPIVNLDIYMDASSSWGIGLVVGSLWRAWQLRPGWQADGHNIGWAESIALEFAVMEAAACGLQNVWVLIHSNNKGSIGQYIHGQSHNPFINESIDCTSSITRDANFDILLEYVKSSKNCADAASHGVLLDNIFHLPHIFHIPEALKCFVQDV